jgi:multiple sugar transport system permease protein
LGLALLIDHATARGARLAGAAFACVMLAWISPPLLTAFIWSRILTPTGGSLNALLEAIGLSPVDPLLNRQMASVILVEVWRGTAFATIILLGALQTIPRGIHEAARIDGMGPLARFRDHTLPLLKPVLALVLLMTTIAASGSFLMIYVLTNGGPAKQTETIALYAYHQAFGAPPFEIAFGAAISVVLLLLNLVFALVYLGIARRRA